MKGRDLLRDYLAGQLTREDVQRELTGRAKESRNLLAIMDADRHGRHFLSDLQPPEGAAERLTQVILSPDLSSTVFRENKQVGRLQKIFDLMPFDVVGAGQPVSKSKSKKSKLKKVPPAKIRRSNQKTANRKTTTKKGKRK
jgi:hypothetical protein